MKKINITIIEVFDDNQNCWEWVEVVRTDDIDMNKTRKEVYMMYFGFDLEEDKDYIKANYLRGTKITNLEI